MTTAQDLKTSTNRKRLFALVISLVGLTAAVLGAAFGAKDRFFEAYLVAFLFWLGVSLGALAFLMTHFLTGSRWGLTIRRITEAAAGTLWLMALLFIPLLLDLPGLFEWARPEVIQSSEILREKSMYLNVPFFIGRAAFYFIVWIGLAFFINRLSARWATTGDETARERLKGWGAFGLIAYTLTMTFAAIDWMMSLEPFWSSTVFGLIIIFGQMVSGLAFAVMVLNGMPELGLGRKWTIKSTPVPYKDLGTLILTFIMSWAYLAYFQLLIIWAGNIPREVTWYVNRTTGGWTEVGVLVAVALFALPFALLLTMRVRHNLRVLAWLSGLIVIASWVNVYWQVIPSFHPGQFSLHWLDLVLPVGMGGLWMAVFLTKLKNRPTLREEEQASIRLEAESHAEPSAAGAE